MWRKSCLKHSMGFGTKIKEQWARWKRAIQKPKVPKSLKPLCMMCIIDDMFYNVKNVHPAFIYSRLIYLPCFSSR